MENLTPRFGLPELAVGQAQKEITHNEALVLIDALLHPTIEAMVSAPPTTEPGDAGKCWIVGPGATGAFFAREKQIAIWTGGSWRFVTPSGGMWVWHNVGQYFQRFIDQQWQEPSSCALPSGGTTIDQECRAVVTQLLGKLANLGLLASA